MEFEDRFVNYTGLFYIEEENVFVDEDGGIVYNIFDFVPPAVLQEFKEEHVTKIYQKTRTDIIELYYPTPGELEELRQMQEEYKRKLYEEDYLDSTDYNGPQVTIREATKV